MIAGATRATVLTAALAGALGSAGLLAFRVWQEGHAPASWPLQAALWGIAVVLLFALPGWHFVVGPSQRRFERLWFKDAAETQRFVGLLNRVVAWFLASVLTTIGLSWL